MAPASMVVYTGNIKRKTLAVGVLMASCGCIPRLTTVMKIFSVRWVVRLAKPDAYFALIIFATVSKLEL